MALSLVAGIALGGVAGSAWAADPAPAAQVWSIESGKALRSLMLDVVAAGPRLVAVGDRGHILYSDDHGQSWTQAKVPTRQLLTAVYFVDAKHGWAVGHDAQILASDDGGATWTKQFEDLKRQAPLLDLWFKDASTGFAVGAYGALLTTSDGGQHWQDVSDRIDNPDQFHFNAIGAVKDSGLFIVGEQGSLFRSRDWGQSWEKVHGPYEGSLFGLLPTGEPQTLLVYGLRGNLFRSTDFGDTWANVPLQGPRGPLEFALSGATRLDDGSLVLVGNSGTVLRSNDDGKTFSLYNRPDRLSLSAVTAGANGTLILAGQGGVRVTAATGADLGQQVGQQ
ncbi:BNR/Asp-box repeat domain-containing protein [Pseudomonas sp. M47T1]|nr:YCF48-related protein [Pseudomonas sp. M47T1]EIK93444.1 BNR/Asp-box repeat domain-containing protein [Pseudomonas sp. M47T1]